MIGASVVKAVRVSALPGLWTLFALAMVRDVMRDPYDPSLTDTAHYGHNLEGALTLGLTATAIELAVVMLLLRPWSYERSWVRSLIALVIFIPWGLLSAILVMHAGGVFVLHFLWVGSLLVILFVSTIWSAVAASKSRTPREL